MCDPECEKFTGCSHNRRNCAPIFNAGLDRDEDVPSSGFECRNCGELMPKVEFVRWLGYPWWIDDIRDIGVKISTQALADSMKGGNLG